MYHLYRVLLSIFLLEMLNLPVLMVKYRGCFEPKLD